jgi:2-dehydro-3-deoxygalactonokinase
VSKQLVAIDWGTTNFRAQLLDEDGSVCDSYSSGNGVGKLTRSDMRDEIRRLRDRWPAAGTDMIACGMIGSSIGWIATPYLPCGSGPADIAGALVESDVDGVRLRIVPGVHCRNADSGWDVMRGEELLAFGWAALQTEPAEASGLCVMPGTHSKWVRMERGRIERFSTAMTGEIYEILSRQSLLRRHITGDAVHGEAFERGVAIGASGAGLARHLFSVRANSLHEELPDADAGSFVSGLLIGSEIVDALRIYGWTADSPPVHLVGARRLIDLYAQALAHFGVRSTTTDSHQASASGFMAIHEQGAQS